MRKMVKRGEISVHAISGSHTVILAMDATDKGAQGLLGFSLHRTDHTENEAGWLKGFKTFQETMPHPSPGQLVSTYDHPIQAFMWGDYTAKHDHTYTYKVVPVYGTPSELNHGKPVEVTISTVNEDMGVHAVYFNRGVAGSQAYACKYGEVPPKSQAALDWLSRGLEKAMLDFIGKAKGKKYALRAAVYEFNYRPALKAFLKASRSGADVKIVYDSRGYKVNKDTGEVTYKDKKPVKSSDEAIDEVGIRKLMIRRTKSPSYISHNKFIVLLENGEPKEVWTGSTNFTMGGIFGQSNVGHVIRDKDIANSYCEYWKVLSTDPTNDKIREWTVNNSPVPETLPPPNSLTPVFSPRSSLEALEWYADRMDKAENTVCFTAAFGVNEKLVKVFEKDKEYPRYLILDNPGGQKSVKDRTRRIQEDNENLVAIGGELEHGLLDRWREEELANINRHVKYIHTKYMIIDPLCDDPVLIGGSANFSEASTEKNDENMVIVRGNKRVIDMYLGEFMRLFNHYYFRTIVKRQKKNPGTKAFRSAFLEPDDSWKEPYYKKNSVKYKERHLWIGEEQKEYEVTFFDIDETIFHTFAMVYVMKKGKIVKKLTNQEYNEYKLKEGEKFDYREFRDAETFERTSKIIRPILAKLKAMHKNYKRQGSTISLLTARGTFPDMATFKDKFRRYGIDIDDIDINFAGDISETAGSVAKAKKQIVMRYLEHGEYKTARLIDDNMENLKAFLSLADDMPEIKFEAIHISEDGKTKIIKPGKPSATERRDRKARKRARATL